LGALAILAARNHDLPGTIPNALPHRLFPSRTNTLTTSMVTAAAVLTTSTLLLTFAFVVSLFPRHLGAIPGSCVADDDGSSCDLVDGTWYQYGIFVLVCLVDPLYALGGPVLVIASVVSLTRRIRAPLFPLSRSLRGARIRAAESRCALPSTGNGLSRGFDVRLQCIEKAEWSVGSSTSSESRTVYDVPSRAARRRRVYARGTIRVRGTAVVPAGAMHSFKSDHNEVKVGAPYPERSWGRGPPMRP